MAFSRGQFRRDWYSTPLSRESQSSLLGIIAMYLKLDSVEIFSPLEIENHPL